MLEMKNNNNDNILIKNLIQSFDNLSIKVNRFSITAEMLYLTPAPLRAQISKISSKELPHFKSIPLAYITIKGFEASVTGSNNPWVVTAKASIQKIKMQEIYNSQVALKVMKRGKTVLV
jgi:hypothetical protein